jgi:hypothetical protein
MTPQQIADRLSLMPTAIYAITGVAFSMGVYLLCGGVAIWFGAVNHLPHIDSAVFGVGIGLTHLTLGYFVYSANSMVRPFLAALPTLNYMSEYSFAPFTSPIQQWELAAIVVTTVLLVYLLFLPTKTQQWFIPDNL